jgi:uncharacterized protein
MDLRHRFTLPAPVEEAWTAFYFPNRIAPCFPGATVDRVDGVEFGGVLKIKLGSLPVEYEGTATFLERSPDDQRIVVQARGQDRRGQGTIDATVTMTFADGQSGTDVEAATTIALTGRTASFGETVVQEVSDRLVQRLVGCLSGKFATGLGDPPSQEELAATTPVARPPVADDATAVEEAPTPVSVATGADPSDDELATVPTAETAEAVPDETVAAETVAAETVADETVPDETVPAETVPDETVPAETVPDGAQAAEDDFATAGTSVSETPDRSAPLSNTAQPHIGTVATVGLPLVRRFGPPLLGALLVGSVITRIVRRLRR